MEGAGARSRLFRQFKNPPQPHMCIEEKLRGAPPLEDTLYINVLGWQKIACPERCSDPIPLYGGMQVPQSCSPNSKKPPLIVFAVMVNPEILKTSGKNAANPMDRDALVSLLCDFVEAMNPGLQLARNPVILKDRDLAGELKDVWLAVQNKRERDKGMSHDYLYKVYDIDGVQSDETGDDERLNNTYQATQNTNNIYDSPNQDSPKSSKQILKNAGQRPEFDSGMNNYQINQCSSALQNYIDAKDSAASNTANNTICTQAYGQIVSTRENHMQVNNTHQGSPVIDNIQHGKTNKSDSMDIPTGWDEFSKRDLSAINNGDGEFNKQKRKNVVNAKESYNFFPVFHTAAQATAPPPALTQSKISNINMVEINDEQKNNKNTSQQNNVDNMDKIVDPMQKLVLHSTDNKICDITS